MRLAEPHKELRFTRAHQALPFWVGGAMCLVAAMVLIVASSARAANPDLPHPRWALAPLGLAVPLVLVAIRCTRHAYLILSPLGVEIFPLFRPKVHFQLVPWGQIEEVEFTPTRLTLHFDVERSSGVHLALGPLTPRARELLRHAMERRTANGAERVGEGQAG